MPILYQTKCDHCGHRSEAFPENYLAVELDKPTGLTSSNPHPDNEADAVLPKTGRSIFLEAHGFTFKSAMKQGRLLKYARLFCRDCGESFEHRKYHISGLQYLGGFWPIITSLSIALAVGFGTYRWALGLAAFVISLLASSAILGGIAEAQLSKELKEQKTKNRDLPRCPRCASIETTKSRIKCEACGHRSAKVVTSSKS